MIDHQFGKSVTFTATVSPVAPGSGTPTGNVTFMDGATILGIGTLSSGVATYTTSALLAGIRSITAVYGGDTNFSASTSPALSQTVYPTIVTIDAATGNGSITLETNTPGCWFSDVQAKTKEQAYMPDPLNYTYLYGLVEFKLHCPTPGQSADVMITFPRNVEGMTYRKCGPNINWYTYNNVTISGDTVTLHLTDGQPGDDTGVDGVIEDLGGPGQPPVSVPTMNEWGMIAFMILAGIGSVAYVKRRKKTKN